MKHMIGCEKKITEHDFSIFSESFIRKPPESFRVFYLGNNGGGLSEEDIEAGLWKLPVHGFIPIKYGDVCIEKILSDIGVIKSDDFGEWLDSEYIPFAYDQGGNVIYMSLRNTDFEKIYLIDFDGGNVFSVADDFEGFVNELYGI
ncbi:SMI1/KNR4 family protein [Oceanospirillum beijerinckii]|uniref:SMI1/KNR4 family protein n=1 Tax=Oceanospirillum beijerinckii TaxID=64976 RepID=UPI000484CF58|nr:SMI1/KNR4 family protein [Oceanospirillum beijerinckii]